LGEPWKSIVLLQWYTGLRPGEACGLKVAQVAGDRIDFGREHKTGWRGELKVIPLGPRGTELVGPWAGAARAAPLDFVFHTLWIVKSEPRPATPGALAHAVERACEAAGVAPWSPNQLRHAYGTRVRRELGLEAAQHALGHSRADVTQVYAEGNLAL